MAGEKEIRNKILSIKNTQKITKAMEMVAASKMRKAQDRMAEARPYSYKIKNVVSHLACAHPEYKHLIGNIESEYSAEQNEINPFLHINLHLALRDQLILNQPKGIKEFHQKLISKYKDSHKVEHLMMECIEEMIYISQKNNTSMDQKVI